MRAIKFMKIDYILMKQQMRIALPLFVIVAILAGKTMGDVWMLFVCSYLLFIATIFSTTPFGSCQRKNTGFLLMLPATVAERVIGRFLFGLSYIGMAVLFCAAVMGVFSLFGNEINMTVVGLMLCNTALGLFIVALEYLICYLFGEGKGNWQYLGNIVRIAPGMAMFFLSMHVVGKIGGEAYAAERMAFLSQQIFSIGLIALGAAFLFIALSVVISVKVIARRDYA